MNFDDKKLLIVGHIAKNVVETSVGQESFWGGAGYQTALAASMFLPKGKIILVSRAGRDFEKSNLEKIGLNSNFVKFDSVNDTDVHFLSEVSEKRTYSSSGNLSQNINLDEIREIKDQIGWVHFASSPPEQQLAWLEEIKSMNLDGVPVSCDTFDTYAEEKPVLVRKIMSSCNLVFANIGEFKAIDGKSLKVDLVLKKGEEGAEYLTDGQSVFSVEAPETQVKDTTGAGDVVAGVFLASLLMGTKKENGLRKACFVAAKSVENYGTEHLVGRTDIGNDFVIETERN